MPGLKKDLLDKLDQQIANELEASHTYLAMSAWFEARSMPGAAGWMRKQAEEERGHAMKFYQHVIDRGARVTLGAIAKPAADYEGAVDVFEHALGHERDVTQQIYALYGAAQSGKDYALQVFLNWFVTEQVEEERTMETIVERFKRVGKDATGLLMLDRELGAAGPSS